MMNNAIKTSRLVIAISALFFLQTVDAVAVQAQSSGVHFQRPGAARQQSQRVNKQFRRPSAVRKQQAQPESSQVAEREAARRQPAKQQLAKQEPAKQQQPGKKRPAAKKKPSRPQSPTQRVATGRSVTSSTAKAARVNRPSQKKTSTTTQVVRRKQPVRRDRQVVTANEEYVQYNREQTAGLQLVSYGCETCGQGQCECDSGYVIAEPDCGMYEPGCGIEEPGCGMVEPGCGLGEPSCGCGEVGCGNCVARPGPDYWCFPICLPRFKDLSVWAGVQGFRGPRDFANGRSDSNFGFNEGINISGRAPIIGQLFPQLSYQIGYRAVQSRLHGTATAADDRSQQFVTAGFFRRVNTGVQLGLVWDLLQDDLDEDIDLHQIRYEISLKSPQGREIGFFGTSSTNDATSSGTLYETVDQYALFVRWAFGNGYESRLWGGGTEDGEGLFGGEFYAPLTNRWALQSNFNYLITDNPDGLAGVSEESWNIGINMVWHLGNTARRGCKSPYRPLFQVGDNGSVFVDNVQ